MAVSKCNNCGATIPAGAAFCPSCGAPKAVEQPPVAQTVQPNQYQMYPTHSSIEGFFDSLFSTKFIILGILLGLLLIWIGNISSIFILSPTSSDLTGIRAASVLSSLGLFIIGVFAIGGGISNKNIDKFVRLGLVFGGIWLVVTNLIFSYAGMMTSLASMFHL